MRTLDDSVPDDGELVRGCLKGDTESLRVFVRRFQSVVFALCYRMLGHREDAEDVAQETFLRVFRSLRQWDPDRPLAPWLLTIAANRCRTWLARRAHRPISSEFVDEIVDRTEEPHRLDLAEELQKALAGVREEYRLCFILYHQHELPLAEIAQVVGSPEGTVKTWLHRVRKELAVQLARRGFMPQVSHELR